MRRPRVEILSKVRETCVCGAVLEYEGTRPRAAATEFRFDHHHCRYTRIWPQARAHLSGLKVDPTANVAYEAQTTGKERDK